MTSELIAVDWGTSRFRAYRLDSAGKVLDRVSAEDGMSTVPAGGFAAVLERHCGAWMKASPDAPVLMAGMVGARNGWAEATYATCPASPKSLAEALLRIDERISIVPGVIAHDETGPDVMRGEETLIFGTDVRNGLVCLPGTHSKWARIEDGIITGFATFMTGETYALYRQHSLLARLAAEPEDLTGFDDGLEAATDERGLLNRLFQARTRVLAGEMSGEKVGPYLSGLLINAEIEGAFKRYGADHLVTLVADGVLAKRYVSALRARGSAIEIFAPERAFLDGLSTLAAAR
ncbi:2-dehydro-3-deoxygalactonokinase [Labrys sp. ZIDIC5]|uniref:2-dehydro-3-deoxygalactonokinase n=1 Tax=Labrys sedimenti TaxID=3106036 RepID=UPI002ACAF981|nr:2-dehydro-3-deoxygalactonokinase [Labrys sp. ZIDIC5]MDZ5451671.1 2-dehydro-3-deoxygalactonokinase [Labrys sp. ZIDIC5]